MSDNNEMGTTYRPARSGPRGNGEKAKNGKKALVDLIKYCAEHKVALIIAILLGIASAVFSLIGPQKLAQVTDLVTAGMYGTIDLSAITTLCVTLTILYVLGWVFGFVQHWVLVGVTKKVTQSMRTKISHKINIMPLKYFDSHATGDVLSRVTNDVDTIQLTMNSSFAMLISSVTLLLGSLIMMLVTNVTMALSAVAAVILGFVAVFFIMRSSQKYFRTQQRELGILEGHVEEIYTAHDTVKAYHGTKDAEDTFDEMNENLYRSAWKSQFFSGIMMPLTTFMGNFGYVIVCIVGAVLVKSGAISFGVIVSFMVYVRLFTSPMSQLSRAFTSLQSALAASERVFDFLAEEELEDESDKTVKLENVRGDVDFSHVQFGYNEDRVIIHDFTASVKAGQKIAIVGPTGAGKTTIVNLLMRFYEVNKGKICVDGVPTTDMSREAVHDLFCMVLQDTWLFQGTLRENLVYAKEGVTDEKLDEVCKTVGLEHYVSTLADGYDTVLDEQTALSAGQRQLVTIARAMIEDSPLLILDEATSSIDTRTELLVQYAMDMLMEGRTSFVIAHRLSTIKNADLILVMRDGDIIESGNHDELMAQNGFYAELYNSQFEDAG